MQLASEQKAMPGHADDAPRDPLFRVLSVEDNPIFQKMLKIALGLYGFEVIAALNGIDALIQYQDHDGQFGAVISNHDMPYLDGLGFVRSVREMDYKGRIIVMTERLNPEDLRGYEPYTICGFLYKPFEVRLLVAMLLQEGYHQPCR
jgi:two-component system, cell cycle sensor histidine kinase and response regulator CckA